ncbi:PREDICTED: tRNA selenocysteine 1-associated protein 1-like isoform X2 [Priapulus caudatus]|nr:PREDICTED: tRNA selenocysteine 1-associated protein 1-like isoform X2 [Priapulus caudatus]
MMGLSGRTIPNSSPAKRFKLNPAIHGGRDQPNSQDFSLFVGELSEDVNDLALYNEFSRRYSSCVSAKVVIDHVGGRSKGFGFVRFTNQTDQEKALVEMQDSTAIGRRAIRISLATPKRQQQHSQQQHHYNDQQHHYQQPYNYQDQQQYQNAPYNQYYGQYNYGSYDQQGAWQWYDQYQNANPPPNVETEQPQQKDAGGTKTDLGDAEEVEDHEDNIDVAEENRKLMERCEDLYVTLENSRWQHYGSVSLEPVKGDKVNNDETEVTSSATAELSAEPVKAAA